MGRKLIPRQSRSSFHNITFKYCYVIRYYPMFPWAIPILRADHLRVTHPFATLTSASRGCRSTCMLKTRRQRSFWARIKLSIIYSIKPKLDSFYNNSSYPASLLINETVKNCTFWPASGPFSSLFSMNYFTHSYAELSNFFNADFIKTISNRLKKNSISASERK